LQLPELLFLEMQPKEREDNNFAKNEQK